MMSIILPTAFVLLSSIIPSHAQNLIIPSTLTGTWKSQGCYTDIGRTLNGDDHTDAANMTLESSIAFCDIRGFNYAGTEYCSQCYCDYTAADGAMNAPMTDCSMACDGNVTEPCGGPNRLNLYWNGTPQPQINPGSGLWSYVGCYTEGTNGRLLPNGVATAGGSANMAVDVCLSACQVAGFNLAGAEYGEVCFAYSPQCYLTSNQKTKGAVTRSRTAESPLPMTGVTMLCANNKAECCGTENRVTVYNFNNTPNSTISSGTSSNPAAPAVVPSIGSYNYYGCQTEATFGRALSSNSTATNSMTLEHCAAWCIGYTFFGTEYGRECYCGNSFGAGSVFAPASDRSFTCSSNASEFCGAANHLSVCQLNGTSIPSSPSTSTPIPSPLVLPPKWSYQGCWVDGVNGRILEYQFPDNAFNTIESCIVTCVAQNQNYTIVGVEYGVQCFCDTAIRNGGNLGKDGECDFLCPGNEDEICGREIGCRFIRLGFHRFFQRLLYRAVNSLVSGNDCGV